EWMVDKDSAAWLPALIPLREDLSNGDLRALYISWLSFVATQWYPREDEDLVEPPVPPGLGALTPTLKALAEFVYVDEDLLAVAAERSRPLPASKQSAVDMLRWIVELTADEKDDIVLRLMTGEAPPLRAELLHRYRQATASPLPLTEGTRQASEIIAAAEAHREERERAERARQAAGRERRERENAAARERYLDRITGTEAELWRQVETLIEVKRPKEYDQAVSLLADLRDLAARQSQTRAFRDRITDLRRRYPTRRGLLQRLDRARLGA
ncbi:MAG TPA: hypothetical protein VFI42_13920, partial [Thermomicrobiaceae bacterium]|nr:hypothetical protein [Thermomicrobiaceae bacterium]